MTLGERLVRLRNQRGLSQDALAESLGVSRQSVSKWETDASVPELDKLVKLSDLFEISLDDLVRGRSVSPVPPQAAPSFSLRERAAALYREKAWLSGWLLVAWGISGLLCSIWNAVVLYLPVGGLMGMLNLLFYRPASNAPGESVENAAGRPGGSIRKAGRREPSVASRRLGAGCRGTVWISGRSAEDRTPAVSVFSSLFPLGPAKPRRADDLLGTRPV